jgi:hypothetical protein
MTDDALKCLRCGVAKSPEHYERNRRVCQSCQSLRRSKQRGTTRRPRRDARWRRELLPLLAVRLAAQLHGERVPPLPKGCRGLELISAEAWQEMTSAICRGTPPEIALRRAGISRDVLTAYRRHEPRLARRFAEAKEVSRRRRRPHPPKMEDVFRELIEDPYLSLRQACARHGVVYRGALARTQEPAFEPRYLSARKIQHFRALDDMTTTAKGPGESDSMSAVCADRAQIERISHRMKQLEPRRLWPRRELTVLEKARKRAGGPRTVRADPEADAPPDTNTDSDGIPQEWLRWRE